MFKLILTKIKSSTLPEVIVGLVIISIISGLALMTIMSISKNSNNRLKIIAIFELENVICETHSEKSYFDEDYEIKNIIIEKTIINYDNNKNLKEITYSVKTKQGKFLFQRKEIIDARDLENDDN